jgi:hypothetical protein
MTERGNTICPRPFYAGGKKEKEIILTFVELYVSFGGIASENTGQFRILDSYLP